MSVYSAARRSIPRICDVMVRHHLPLVCSFSHCGRRTSNEKYLQRISRYGSMRCLGTSSESRQQTWIPLSWQHAPGYVYVPGLALRPCVVFLAGVRDVGDVLQPRGYQKNTLWHVFGIFGMHCKTYTCGNSDDGGSQSQSSVNGRFHHDRHSCVHSETGR